MAFKGYFIDDTPEDAVYARILSSSIRNGLQLKYLEVSEATKLTNELFQDTTDIVLLDFRLDENPDMIPAESAYKGSGLAQLLRDKSISDPLKDFPIVLISAEDNFNNFYRPDRTAHDLFDKAYGKEYATSAQAAIQNHLVSLCEGYKLLKEVWHNDRMIIFTNNDEDRQAFDQQDITLSINDAAAPHIAARAIMKNLIARDGILISTTEALARLGIDSSGKEDLEKLLNQSNIRYQGIFSSGWTRWLSHRFDAWAEEILGRRPGSLTGTQKSEILNKNTGLNFRPAISTWSGSSDEKFIFSCASCEKPTEVRHSLAAYDHTCPRHGQRRRICWDCIQTEKYTKKHLLIDEADQDLVEKIKLQERS